MKNSSIIIAAFFVMTLSSCFVGRGGGWHHHREGARVEIRADNHLNQNDSLQANAVNSGIRKDLVQSSSGTDNVK